MVGIKKITEERIRTFVRNYFEEFMGEKSGRVYSALFNNALTVCLTDVLSPAEEYFAHSRDNLESIQSIKSRQFDIIKAKLMQQLTEFSGKQIRDINTFITDNGERFLVIYFGKKVGRKKSGSIQHICL